MFVPTHHSRLAAQLMLSWAECPGSVWDTSSRWERNESDALHEEPVAFNTYCWNPPPSSYDSSYIIIMVAVPEMLSCSIIGLTCIYIYIYRCSWPWLHHAEICFFHNGNLKGKNNDRSDINPVYSLTWSFLCLFLSSGQSEPLWVHWRIRQLKIASYDRGLSAQSEP